MYCFIWRASKVLSLLIDIDFLFELLLEEEEGEEELEVVVSKMLVVWRFTVIVFVELTVGSVLSESIVAPDYE